MAKRKVFRHNQPMSTKNFYKNLPSFHEFQQMTQDQVYHQVPADWWVLMTDIKGSTKAIEQGKYRTVNALGASCITAILNATEENEVPYSFGGDGATFLVSPEQNETCYRILLGMQKKAQEEFQMELRVGRVPILDLLKKGSKVQVAKYLVAPTSYIAMFRGGGLTLAEKMIKAQQELPSEILWKQALIPNLNGLSCRWNPIPPQRGHVVSVLIQHRKDFSSWTDFLQRMELALGFSVDELNPVHKQGLILQWIPAGIQTESRVQKSGKPLWLQKLKIILNAAFVHLLVLSRLRVGGFQGDEYIQSMSTHADYRKFDDILRLVLDLSSEQKAQLEKFLEAEYQAQHIFYGVHASTHALMTCMVFSATQGKHLHFVDGAQGGYALAALQLKQQWKNNAQESV